MRIKNATEIMIGMYRIATSRVTMPDTFAGSGPLSALPLFAGIVGAFAELMPFSATQLDNQLSTYGGPVIHQNRVQVVTQLVCVDRIPKIFLRY